MKEKEYKKKIRRFRCRMNIEAGIRAVTIGLAAGLAGMAVTLLCGRVFVQKILFAEACIVAVILLLLTMVVSFSLLKPKRKEVLARIDGLGLKERIITMEELRQEETVMAQKQRQDAMKHLLQLDAKRLKLKLYITPLCCSLGLAIVIALLILLPFPKQQVDEQVAKNEQEMELVDEMVAALTELVNQSEANNEHKEELQEIIEALAMSFTPEDSTLTRTAKIATASRRLDMYESAEQNEVNLLKQQAENSEEAKVQEAQAEQRQLSQTIKDMKDLMGTSIDILNQVEGTFWSPGAPTAGTSYDVEELPEDEASQEGEESQENQESGEGEELPEGMEPGEDGEPQEGMDGEWNGAGAELIYDPMRGEVGYGTVYEEYYQAILKALTEREYSEDIREIIEDYANSLE